MHANSNGSNGILVIEGTVSGNIASANGSAGIDATKAAVSGNTADGNQFVGITAHCPSSVVGNTAVGNGMNIQTVAAGCVLANNAAP